jgi:hypothetical protein
MVRFRNPIAWALGSVVGVLLVMVWIARPPAPAAKPTRPATVKYERPPGPPPFVSLTSIVPDRLAIDGDHVANQVLDVTYRIQDADRVQTAKLYLWAPDVGDLGQLEVPAQATATVRFLITPGEHSVGPELRFRAACPEGTSNWYTLGQLPPPDDAPVQDGVTVDHMFPESIGWQLGDPLGMKPKSQRIILNGSRFSPACTIESEANRSRIELQDIKYDRKTLQGVLQLSDIGTDRVTPRYAELKIVVTGPDLIRSFEQKVPFSEGR